MKIAAGLFSGALGSAFVNPADLIKVRVCIVKSHVRSVLLHRHMCCVRLHLNAGVYPEIRGSSHRVPVSLHTYTS